MAWQREYVQAGLAPKPPSPVRWLLIVVLAAAAAVLMFLLYAVLPELQTLNVWAFTASPVVVAILALAARMHAYGGALNEYTLLQERSRLAQVAWAEWGQRYMAAMAGLVLLPEHLSAVAMMKPRHTPVPHSGKARRIVGLPKGQKGRALAGLAQLMGSLSTVLAPLPPSEKLSVTVLTDAPQDEHAALADACRQHLSDLTPSSTPTGVHVTSQLSFAWMEETLKTPGEAVELILVIQAHGKDAYSDGLAALLLCPDAVAKAHKLPIAARLLRPMPLDIDSLETDFTSFLQIQATARQANGLLADRADWQPETTTLLAAAAREGAALAVDHRWILEPVNGVPGPCGHWLLAALGIEMTRLAKEPLLLLASEHSGRWINTVTPGDMA
ncbi:hypothetical protein [Pseudomonas petrae]|uniref:PrgI family protein n=1 Tax=Pseudomonas petrae TaxID=2912190 RepID=A0ABS9I3F7_9PSED|nr:hypothetical protein [Pseudomonas petrae]MCF7536035.1 hypothetical protein [Pseudomonas petrae]MCF7541741.1 hypothetical protein [Pseudomonas petrae]MCF7557583.1 hypothetical protein [Pseudomonas petrae]